MSVTALKRAEPVGVTPATAKVLPLPETPRKSQLAARVTRMLGENVLPPLVVLAVLLGIWQLAFSGAGSGLPAPSDVWDQRSELILRRFFVCGTQDIGLGWRVLTSLERVADGFGLAAISGVLVGAAIGQSVWLMRGLDPIFQVLRTVPPLGTAADFVGRLHGLRPLRHLRDLHHCDLDDHHQHCRRGPRHPARLPQRCRRPAAQPSGVLFQDHDPRRSTLHLPGSAHRRRAVVADLLAGGVGIGFVIWDAWNPHI